MEPAKGRPRDTRIDEAVLRATRELISEEGFSATTIQAVARRAGVSAPAIYRRWRSRLDLIMTATAVDLDEESFTPTGDLYVDVKRFVDTYQHQFSRPTFVALPGVLGESANAPDDVSDVVQRLAQGVRPAFRAMLAAASPAVDPDVNPDTVLDVIIGACLYRAAIHPFTGRVAKADDITDLIVRSLRRVP
jgi:AcrR family transcriptional regulator